MRRRGASRTTWPSDSPSLPAVTASCVINSSTNHCFSDSAMIMFAICAPSPSTSDSGFSSPSCSFFSEGPTRKTLRSSRKLVFAQDSSTQTAGPVDPKLLRVARRLAVFCADLDREFDLVEEALREKLKKTAEGTSRKREEAVFREETMENQISCFETLWNWIW